MTIVHRCLLLLRHDGCKKRNSNHKKSSSEERAIANSIEWCKRKISILRSGQLRKEISTHTRIHKKGWRSFLESATHLASKDIVLKMKEREDGENKSLPLRIFFWERERERGAAVERGRRRWEKKDIPAPCNKYTIWFKNEEPSPTRRGVVKSGSWPASWFDQVAGPASSLQGKKQVGKPSTVKQVGINKWT